MNEIDEIIRQSKIDEHQLTDLRNTTMVEIEVINDRVYVNVDGLCRLRIYNPGDVVIRDCRTKRRSK